MGLDAWPTARGAHRTPRGPATPRTEHLYPTWPFTWLFALFPLWWAVGVVDLIAILAAVPMLVYLVRARQALVPRGFGVWVTFMLFMLASVIELTRGRAILTFGYRAASYAAATIVLIYVYNARRTLTDQRILRHLTIFWVSVVVGGFLGVARPTGLLHTPMFYAVRTAAPGLMSNDIVGFMVVRHFAQYSPNGYFHIPPRPSAPFLYTNNWGNAYSLLIPLVLVYFTSLPKGSMARRAVGILLAVSVVPALLTLNRGMFIGLGLSLVYVSCRLVVQRRSRAAFPLLGLVALATILFFALNVSSGLHTRTEASTSTRSLLYTESLQAAHTSPLLGYGVPVVSSNPGAPAVGTQGQVWMVLVSHGVIATVCFIGFFLVVVVRTRRRRDPVGLACNTIILVGTIEMIYYGSIPYTLPLMMTVAALALRPRPAPAPPGAHQASSLGPTMVDST